MPPVRPKRCNPGKHLREVYWLNYLYYEKLGNCPKAFENYKLSREYADSVSNIENTAHLQNIRVNFEKEKSSRELALIQENYQMEQRATDQKYHLIRRYFHFTANHHYNRIFAICRAHKIQDAEDHAPHGDCPQQVFHEYHP